LKSSDDGTTGRAFEVESSSCIARPALDKPRLGQLIDLVSNIRVGDTESRSKDILGRVYEYFLSQFASAEGKKGGEFYTPRCIMRLLVEMLEPFTGGLRSLLWLFRDVRSVHRVAASDAMNVVRFSFVQSLSNSPW